MKKIVLVLIFKNRFSFRESVFLWRFKIQYWLPCWKFYAQSPKRSHSNSERKQKKIYPKQLLCPKMSTGHLLRTFDKLAENFLTKLGIFCSNSNKISHFSPKKLFFYKVLCWLLQCNFDNPAEILIDNYMKLFCRKPEFKC